MNKDLEEDMEIHCDLRQFAGYTITEHLVLTNDDLKAVNTEAQPDTVAPAKGNTVSLKDGELPVISPSTAGI